MILEISGQTYDGVGSKPKLLYMPMAVGDWETL